jgi:hypothetical protein
MEEARAETFLRVSQLGEGNGVGELVSGKQYPLFVASRISYELLRELSGLPLALFGG